MTVMLATSRRILSQLRHDPRTVTMLLVVPSVLMILLRYVFDSARAFDDAAPSLLGVFPFVIMFLVASVTTLRERTTGTLERLMTMPIGKLELLVGYAVAFGLLAVAQVAIAAVLTLTWLGLDIAGSVWLLLLVAMLDAVLGMALGLFASAFARTEFQAVQSLSVVVLPQVLLCGLFVPRAEMASLLDWISDVLPLSHAVEAMHRVHTSSEVTGELMGNLAIVAGCAVLALVLGAATLRRRTP